MGCILKLDWMGGITERLDVTCGVIVGLDKMGGGIVTFDVMVL